VVSVGLLTPSVVDTHATLGSAPNPEAVALAGLETDMMGKVMALASDPKDRLARALARLGRAFMARDS
jgi:hypothetical protein